MKGIFIRLHEKSIQRFEEARRLVERRQERRIPNRALIEYMTEYVLQSEEREALERDYKKILGVLEAYAANEAEEHRDNMKNVVIY